jgi:hypothetical protein
METPSSAPEYAREQSRRPSPPTSGSRSGHDEEHWRFTDLSGFDPEAFSGSEAAEAAPSSMVALDVPAEAVVTETGIEITRAPAEIRFEPAGGVARAARIARRLAGRQVRGPQRGGVAARLLVHVPGGLELEAAAVRARRERDRERLALLAAAGRGRGGLPLLARRGVRVRLGRVAGVLQRRAELFVQQAAKLEYVSLQNLSRETVALRLAPRARRARRRARLGRRRLRLQARQGADPERPRRPGRHLARDRRLLRDGEQHLDYDTFQEHIAPDTESDFAFKGALRDHATAVWRGMIRVEKDAQKTNAYQECRNLMLSPTTHAVPIPGSRSWPTTCAARTARRSAASTASRSST